MNQRRRLAVLSEHMESRLVLSPVAIVPIRGIESTWNVDVPETTNDNFESSEVSTGRSGGASLTSQRTSTVQDNTVVSKLPVGTVETASPTAAERGPQSRIVNPSAGTATTEVASKKSPTTTNEQNNDGSEQSADWTTSSVAVANPRLPTATTPAFEARPASADEPVKAADGLTNDDVRRPTITSEQPTNDDASRAEDPVLAPRGQETSNDIIIKAPTVDGITVGTTDTSTRTESVVLTAAPSRQISKPAPPAETPSSTITSDSQTIDAKVERSDDGLSTELTVEKGSNTSRTPTVRPASQVQRTDVTPDSVEAETQSREAADSVNAVRSTDDIVSVSNIGVRSPEQRITALMPVEGAETKSTGDEPDQVSVRPAADTNVEPRQQQPLVAVVETRRTSLSDVDTDATSPAVNDPASPVAVILVDERTTTPEERITDTVERSDVAIVSTEIQRSIVDDTDSVANENVESAATSDAETQRDSTESPPASDSGATISSSLTAEGLTRQDFVHRDAGQWLSDHTPVQGTSTDAGTHAVTARGSESTSPLPSWLFLAEATAQTHSELDGGDTTHTFFGDATRVGLMLAAVNHAGRRSGSLISVTESLEEQRSEGSPYSRERRRRRGPTGRRMPTSFDRLRQAINPLETVDEHSALPSPDAVFADAASMSLLYQSNFGGGQPPRYGFLWGSLLLGGAGLAVNRAGRGRRSQTRRPLIPPAAPRNSGETLKFSD